MYNFIKTADTEDYSTHPFETSPPGCLEVARLGTPRSQPTLSRQAPPVVSKGCARPHPHPVPIPLPQPLHSRQAIMCNMTVIICTSCQTRNICLVASPWSRRLPLDSLHHPGAHASHPPTQEWKGPGTRQHPSSVSYPLWPKMSGMAQGILLQLFLKPDQTQDLA